VSWDLYVCTDRLVWVRSLYTGWEEDLTGITITYAIN
jgi:hypothetical protein